VKNNRLEGKLTGFCIGKADTGDEPILGIIEKPHPMLYFAEAAIKIILFL
jgi:hypothetical protein